MNALSKLGRTESSIKIDGEYCSKCMICPSVCPFDALSLEGEPPEVKIDVEKCQVCGLCFTACPSSAIETIYYNVDLLLNYVGRSRRKKGISKLVLTCRGAGPLNKETTVGSKKRRVEDSLTLTLPCVGRVPPELLLKALSLGMKQIVVLPCEDKFCRFKDGSMIETRRFLLIQALLKQLGYGPDALTVTKRSVKARVDAYRCISCGNCGYACEFDAIKMEVPGIAQVNPEACSGCGACATVCPVFAIKLEGFEYDAVSNAIRNYSSLIRRMKRRTEKPAILILSCDWSDFSRLDSPNDVMIDNTVLLRLPCAGAVDGLHVLEAFYSGFDGVFVAACRRGECKLEKGNEKAEERVSLLKKLLGEVNLEDRLEMCFVSPKNVGDLNERIKLFSDKIGSLTVKKAM